MTNGITKIEFNGLTIDVRPDNRYDWLMESRLVAEGYAVTVDAIYLQLKRRADEFEENQHFITADKMSGVDNMKPNTVYWTKNGVVKLGFFLKGERAKKFRTFAEHLVVAKLEELSKPASLLDQMELNLRQFREHDTRILTLEQQVQQITQKAQESEAALLELERSTDTVPEPTTRAKIRRIVHEYAKAKSVEHRAVWNKVYDWLYDRCGISIRARKRMPGENLLDVAERLGYLDRIFAIVSSELI